MKFEGREAAVSVAVAVAVTVAIADDLIAAAASVAPVVMVGVLLDDVDPDVRSKIT